MAPKKLTELSVRELKQELEERKLKATLRNRLEEALRSEGEDPEIYKFVAELDETIAYMFCLKMKTSFKKLKLEKPKDVLNNNNLDPMSLERSVEEKHETVAIVAGSLESEFVINVNKLEQVANWNLQEEIKMPITLKLENKINDETALKKKNTETLPRATLTTIKLSPFNEKMSSVKVEKMASENNKGQ